MCGPFCSGLRHGKVAVHSLLKFWFLIHANLFACFHLLYLNWFHAGACHHSQTIHMVKKSLGRTVPKPHLYELRWKSFICKLNVHWFKIFFWTHEFWTSLWATESAKQHKQDINKRSFQDCSSINCFATHRHSFKSWLPRFLALAFFSED